MKIIPYMREWLGRANEHGKLVVSRSDASDIISVHDSMLAACQAVAGVYRDAHDMPLYARKCIAATAKAEIAARIKRADAAVAREEQAKSSA